MQLTCWQSHLTQNPTTTKISFVQSTWITSTFNILIYSGILPEKVIFDHTPAHLHRVLPRDLPAHSTPRTPLRPRPKEGVLVVEAFYNLQVFCFAIKILKYSVFSELKSSQSCIRSLSRLLMSWRDCKRNFKRPFVKRALWPINNGTNTSCVWSSMNYSKIFINYQV